VKQLSTEISRRLTQGCHVIRKCKEVTLIVPSKVNIPPGFSETVPEIRHVPD
jgi:hypothetical protein